ncbi:hypothetical protein K491DRAFT_435690 [Lophiostoma macrostomum CBS 122681]|uniref:Uncharacterized protein n=1 Tax=Lophiostoma macrostomum CBS 122681 TaxID=1314788 RepID=A0A6A6T8P5_9PLEO|nr:hypothetical protein K491DRAFT_435690 [Lophiostoma macrostomum CBS 122681]
MIRTCASLSLNQQARVRQTVLPFFPTAVLFSFRILSTSGEVCQLSVASANVRSSSILWSQNSTGSAYALLKRLATSIPQIGGPAPRDVFRVEDENRKAGNHGRSPERSLDAHAEVLPYFELLS